MHKWKIVRRILSWIAYFFLFLFVCALSGSILRGINDGVERSPVTSEAKWFGESYGYAPHPDDYAGAIVQVYAGRTRGVKQALAVHTWIAVKKERGYRIYGRSNLWVAIEAKWHSIVLRISRA